MNEEIKFLEIIENKTQKEWEAFMDKMQKELIESMKIPFRILEHMERRENYRLFRKWEVTPKLNG